jgi:hypothetical protein
MATHWLLDCAWPPVAAQRAGGFRFWCSSDGQRGRAYAAQAAAPAAGWTALECLQSIDGRASGAPPLYHYTVETDVAPEHERELNAWYEQEHLPGLADVPGTIRALRYRRLSGGPLYLACYDLVSPGTLERPEWLAVRHTAWSSRVRPHFCNTRRTMHFLAEG